MRNLGGLEVMVKSPWAQQVAEAGPHVGSLTSLLCCLLELSAVKVAGVCPPLPNFTLAFLLEAGAQ